MRKDTHETPVERTSTLVLRNLRALDDRPPDPVSGGQGLRARLVHVRGRVEGRSDEASDRTRDEVVSERLALGLEGQDGEGLGVRVSKRRGRSTVRSIQRRTSALGRKVRTEWMHPK